MIWRRYLRSFEIWFGKLGVVDDDGGGLSVVGRLFLSVIKDLVALHSLPVLVEAAVMSSRTIGAMCCWSAGSISVAAMGISLESRWCAVVAMRWR